MTLGNLDVTLEKILGKLDRTLLAKPRVTLGKSKKRPSKTKRDLLPPLDFQQRRQKGSVAPRVIAASWARASLCLSLSRRLPAPAKTVTLSRCLWRDAGRSHCHDGGLPRCVAG